MIQITNSKPLMLPLNSTIRPYWKSLLRYFGLRVGPSLLPFPYQFLHFIAATTVVSELTELTVKTVLPLHQNCRLLLKTKTTKKNNGKHLIFFLRNLFLLSSIVKMGIKIHLMTIEKLAFLLHLVYPSDFNKFCFYSFILGITSLQV